MSISITFPPALSMEFTASLDFDLLRMLPMTLWPAFRARRQRIRPKPFEAPVISQTGEDIFREEVVDKISLHSGSGGASTERTPNTVL